MELSKALRKGYYAKLNGNVMNGTKTVPVYDALAIPEGEDTYILIYPQSIQQRPVKGCKIYDATMIVDVVALMSEAEGMYLAETIADQVEMLINPDDRTDIDITANGFEIGDTLRIEDTPLGGQGNYYHVYRKLMTYKHIITKN